MALGLLRLHVATGPDVTVSQERRGLERIRRSHQRFWILASLWLPVAYILLRRTSHPELLAPFSIIWGIAVVSVARQVARSRCPRCNNYFHSKTDAPGWRPLSTPSLRCARCGLALRSPRVIYPSLE